MSLEKYLARAKTLTLGEAAEKAGKGIRSAVSAVKKAPKAAAVGAAGGAAGAVGLSKLLGDSDDTKRRKRIQAQLDGELSE